GITYTQYSPRPAPDGTVGGSRRFSTEELLSRSRRTPRSKPEGVYGCLNARGGREDNPGTRMDSLHERPANPRGCAHKSARAECGSQGGCGRLLQDGRQLK